MGQMGNRGRRRPAQEGPRCAPPKAAAVLAAASLFLVAMVLPRAALADGAFPDSETILAPATRPGQIVLVTNFGLILSEDRGLTWTWSCERDVNAYGILYQQDPSPRRRLFTIANRRLVFSDDLSCGWTAAGGLLADHDVTDAFVDRVLADRVLAVGARCCESGQPVYSVFESTDAGVTFTAVRYVATPGTIVTGVESAQSDARTLYLTLAPAPVLVRSSDGGITWTPSDLGSQIGAGVLRLIAIDPDDPRKVFLLLTTPSGGQALVVTTDGGVTAARALAPDGVIRNFIRTAAGTILLAVDLGGNPTLFRSQDRGATYQTVFNPPHARAFAERDGVIYAATDDVRDLYAAAASTDEGTSWRPILSYDQVGAIVPCLKRECRTDCEVQARKGIWPSAMCVADPPPPPDGGAAGAPGTGGAAGAGTGGLGGPGGAEATGGAGSGGAGAGGSGTGGVRAGGGAGCRCDAGGGVSAPGAPPLVLLLLLVAATTAIVRGRAGTGAGCRRSRSRAAADPPRARTCTTSRCRCRRARAWPRAYLPQCWSARTSDVPRSTGRPPG
jgi:hypothetical protein